MLQELCRNSFINACKTVSNPLVRERGRKSPFLEFYSVGYIHNWHRVPLKQLHYARRDSGVYMTRIKAWHYITENADRLREHYLRVKFGRDIEKAMTESGSFESLFEGFYDYFEERKEKFMSNTEKLLADKTAALASRGKMPQSHGGVANLLKVLTKTMHDQGSSIYTIAKVQYAVCMQAGIYIPDDFLTDVLVAHEMIAEG